MLMMLQRFLSLCDNYEQMEAKKTLLRVGKPTKEESHAKCQAGK